MKALLLTPLVVVALPVATTRWDHQTLVLDKTREPDSRVVLRWPNPKAPGGSWVDVCIVSRDGKAFAGQNQNNVKITGLYVLE